MTKELILILDFGSPYTQLIAQRIRESHVFSRIVPYNISAKQIKQQKPKGIIFSGGPTTACDDKKVPLPDRDIFRLDIPILGIECGMKIILRYFGSQIKSAKFKSPEFPRCELFIDDTRHLFWQMPNNITCQMGWAYEIKKLPAGFRVTAHTRDNPVAAVENSSRKIFAVAFHPEAVATQRGSQILSNFLYKICGCIGTWAMSSFIKETQDSIKRAVGKSKVILNLNGTLNSYVTALLINKAIRRRLKCIFIDNGLLLDGEVMEIKKVFGRNFHLNLSCVDRGQRFLHALQGVIEPEEKRKIVSNLSAKIFQEETKKLRGAEFLAQGVLYPEISKTQAFTVYNEDPRESTKRLKPLQPLKDLFEEEVKVIAKELGLSDNIIFRQPMPSAGLAIRIIGEVTNSRLKILREAQDCLVEEIKAAGIYEQISQSFAILLPMKNIIAIRCIASTNGIIADWVRLPYPVLEKISRRILNKVKGINRVVYDISPQPPATIEWE